MKIYIVALYNANTAQKMKFSIKSFFSKFDQICCFLRIWSHLLKKSLMKNFIFCAVRCLAGSQRKYNSDLSVIFFCLGFFVYPALKSRLRDSNYYGISNYMDKDGLTDTGQLCESKTRQGLKVTGIYYFH